MAKNRIFWTAAALIAAFVLGMLAAPRPAAARAPRQPLGLGAPAASILATHGAPAKIAVDGAQHTQTWFYANAEGGLMPRYGVNQGLVVKIFGKDD